MEALQFDEAFDVLVEHCAEVGPPLAAASQFSANSVRVNTYGHDIWIAGIVRQHFRNSDQIEDRHYRPFYDAAWELCRLGVLRPGQNAPKGQGAIGATAFQGDGYSITAFGLEWLLNPHRRSAGAPSRMNTLFAGFHSMFGAGFSQRASEAVACHRDGTYLACCVLTGAAAESILLAVAVTKAKDEARVLKDYSSAGGRDRTTKFVVQGLPDSIARQFKAGLYLLQYWRDNAAHGKATTISEVEAYTSLALLLRLAQFCSDQWSDLTS